MAWYKTGTISVTNGAAVVYGAGTAWVDAGVLNAGDIISINGVLYEILSIQSNTQLTLASNYLGVGAAGISYAIMPIGLLPSALAQQVKTTLATANAALSAAVRYDVQNLTAAQQQAARNNIAALGAADVGAGRLVRGGEPVPGVHRHADGQYQCDRACCGAAVLRRQQYQRCIRADGENRRRQWRVGCVRRAGGAVL